MKYDVLSPRDKLVIVRDQLAAESEDKTISSDIRGRREVQVMMLDDILVVIDRSMTEKRAALR